MENTQYRYHMTLESSNAKTGPIPVTTSSRDTCPSSCAFKKNGCYADQHPMARHWDAVTQGTRGTDWETFLNAIRSLPYNQVWRHNQAGDLPMREDIKDCIDREALAQLIDANTHKRGFTYTHYPVIGVTSIYASNRMAIRQANANGFTINASANNDTEAEAMTNMGLPTCVTTTTDKPYALPNGRKVIPCPAQVREGVTCATCGNGKPLCSLADRQFVIGFIAHGAGKKRVINIINEGA